MSTASLSETERSQELAFLATIDVQGLLDAFIYWCGYERLSTETNDGDRAELAAHWMRLIDEEIARRQGGAR
jgi:hypothetical protein